MIIVVFSAGGCVFIVVFLLFLLLAATNQLCTGISEFIENNLIAIIGVLGGITVAISALAGLIRGKFRFFLANFMAISPLMICLVYGLYRVTTAYADSFFLAILALIAYAVVFVIEAVVTTGISVCSVESGKIWPLVLTGIGGLVFNLIFW